MTLDSPLISVVIVTRNRKPCVLDAVRSCFAQTYRPREVLVFDGASTDGTPEAVLTQFPQARYLRSETDPGFPVLRNRGLREARGEWVVSLDDDAYFSDPLTLQKLAEEIPLHPGAAAIAMPFVEPLRPTTALRASAPAAPRSPLRTFVGCAVALRRQAVLDIGGYREIPHYFKEDRDLSLRLLHHGWSIVRGATPPVVHLYSPRRDLWKRFADDVQTSLLFDWLNIPQPYVFPRMLLDAAQLLFYRFRAADFLPRVGYLLRGTAACLRHTSKRQPVSRSAYRLYRKLPPGGATPWTGAPPAVAA